MNKAHVCIIGAGATGAYAYQACLDLGAKVDILTEKMSAPPPGAFYLHWLPANLKPRFAPEKVLYVGLGTKVNYLKRQWPELTEFHNSTVEGMTTSFPSSPRWEYGWDARAVWEGLWDGANITLAAGRYSDQDIKDLAKTYDLVFHTFPSQESAATQPKLVMVPIQVYKEMAMGQSVKKLVGDFQHFIIYNGLPPKEGHPWVRLSQIWGRVSAEHSHTSALAKGGDDIELRPDLVPGTHPWKKLIGKNILPIGRYATWERSYLSHMAFFDVWNTINEWADGRSDFRNDR